MGYDKELTRQILGEVGPLRFNPIVIKICDGCGNHHKVRYKGRKKPTDPYYCGKCVANRPEVKKKKSDLTMKQWENNDFRELVTNNSRNNWKDLDRANRMTKVRTDQECIIRLIKRNKTRFYDSQKISEQMKKLWRDPEYRNKITEIRKSISLRLWQDDQYRTRISQATTDNWMNPEYRKRITDISIENWKKDNYVAKVLQGLRHPDTIAKIRAHSLKCWEDQEYRQKVARVCVSSIQGQLYSLLDDLGVVYYRERQNEEDDKETKIGPYSFDCVVPRARLRTLLIECQGDYWHSLDIIKGRDKAKASYVANNLSSKFELKYIWEHEFKNKRKVFELLKYWLGMTELTLIEFNFSDIKIQAAPVKDYKLLLSKYHYLTNAGRGGIAIGAYSEGELIAIAIFSPLPRQNIAIENHQPESTRELSRFCINPRYQKKNFGSWFLSRAIRLLDKKYSCIVAYADTTFNHDGALYKSLNFKLDKAVRPDYWYVSEDGWAMHKKTLYNHAKSLGMVEKEFADRNGYRKIWGSEKLRFVFER